MFVYLSISKITCHSHGQRKRDRYLIFSMDTHLGKVRIMTEKFGPVLITSAKYSKSLKSEKG